MLTLRDALLEVEGGVTTENLKCIQFSINFCANKEKENIQKRYKCYFYLNLQLL